MNKIVTMDDDGQPPPLFADDDDKDNDEDLFATSSAVGYITNFNDLI